MMNIFARNQSTRRQIERQSHQATQVSPEATVKKDLRLWVWRFRQANGYVPTCLWIDESRYQECVSLVPLPNRLIADEKGSVMIVEGLDLLPRFYMYLRPRPTKSWLVGAKLR